MSGELQIVFIYDTLSVKKEEDDPKDAILYFHPDCIPEERRIAICGQLMGITHFLRDTFSSPKILTLDNGKFAMRKFGRQYVLALGCSSVTPDWLLEKQMHQDFNVYPNISELIIRGEDHVVYGYQCVGSEVFYQQSAGLQPGLPMPSDLMGKVPFKAKRRLERDHNILLL